jgi:hypothetical protein
VLSGFRSGLDAGQSLTKAMLFALIFTVSLSAYIACGIIMMKKSDVGIILKQWDNMPPKNFISIALGIPIPFDNTEISSKVRCNACTD